MKYEVHPSLFLRAPFYSFRHYDLHNLPEILQRKEFRFAVKQASAVFYQVLLKKDFCYERLSEKEIHTLRKYYNRMSFRATPFGSFATVTAVQWVAEKETIQLAGDEGVSIVATKDWTQLEEGKHGQLFRNPLMYRLGASWRYIVSDPGTDGAHHFSLQELDAVRLNNGLLRKVGQGIKAEILREWVAAQTGVETDSAADYIRYLTQEQVLVKDNARYLIEPAAELDKRTSAVKVVPLAAAAQADESKPVYSLLSRPLVSGGPHAGMQRQLVNAIHGLSLICGIATEPALTNFISAFTRRFDRQQVPLLEALDPDMGVPYDHSSLIAVVGEEGKDPDFTGAIKEKKPAIWSAFHRLLFSLWRHGSDGGMSKPIRINTAQLDELGESSGVLPPTLGVFFRTTTVGLALEGISGASATQLIGRFSLLSDEAFRQGAAMAEQEINSNPDVLFADINHQAEEHVDNINRRLQLYRFEISLNGISGLPGPAQISPDDLLVSVRNGELILESKRLKKRVIPRLSTAYNFNRSQLPVFNLLCAMQYQGLKAINIPQLDQLFPGQTAYPRLCLEDTILSPAKWIFKKDIMDRFAADLQNKPEHALADFLEQWSLPALIALGHTDQQLVFDLTDPLDSACFLKEIAGKQEMIIREYLPSDKSIRAGSAPVAGQYLAYLTHNQTGYSWTEMTAKVTPRAKRYFHPGDEWLYLQVFCTPQSADRLLSDVVAPVVGRLKGNFKTWFFIRYDEGGNHLRLRFKINPADSAKILIALNAGLRRKGLQAYVQDIRVETYRPELERYPFYLMSKVEKVFEAGSDLILSLAVREHTPEVLLVGLRTVELMLQNYQFSFLDQLRLSASVSEALMKEMGGTRQLRIDLNNLYREQKIGIELFFSNTDQTVNAHDQWQGLGESVKLLFNDTTKLSGKSRERLIIDLIHMQLNRTFTDQPRFREMKVWYCLYKYLMGAKAQSKTTVL